MNTQIVPINRDADGVLLVTSATIAENTDRQHESILRVIDDNRADFEDFGEVRFEIGAGYKGAQVRVAHLDEPQATLLLTYLRNNEKVRTFKKGLVKAFFDMARQLQSPAAPAELSRMQILQMAMEAEQKNLALEAQAKADAPKVAYVEQFVAADDRVTFRALAGNLGVKESDLRKLLTDKHWIYCETEQRWSNTAGKLETRNRYSAYSDKKPYFQNVLNHDAPRFKGGDVMHTLKVTPAGAEAIARLIAKEAAA